MRVDSVPLRQAQGLLSLSVCVCVYVLYAAFPLLTFPKGEEFFCPQELG